MAIKPAQNEIRSWSTGFLLALAMLPAVVHAAPPLAGLSERSRQLIEVSEKFDREYSQKESLYKRQMVSAILNLAGIVLINEAHIRAMNPPLVPSRFAAELSQTAEVIFAAYGVNMQGPFVSDIAALWTYVEESGALVQLPADNSPAKARQEAIQLQQDLMKHGSANMLAFIGMSPEAIKRSIIDAAAAEVARDPKADIIKITIEKMEQMIRRLSPENQPAPREYRRGTPVSIG